MSDLIGWARVSSVGQELASQVQELEAAGCRKVFQGKHSGKAESNQAALDEMLAYLRDGDTLVVTKLDRLGRNLKHLIEIVEQLKAEGKHFCSLTEQIDTESAPGTLIFHLFCALAEFERNLTRERIQAGLKSARARGRQGGRKKKITEAVVRRIVADVKANPSVPITQICKEHGISRASYYNEVYPLL